MQWLFLVGTVKSTTERYQSGEETESFVYNLN